MSMEVVLVYLLMDLSPFFYAKVSEDWEEEDMVEFVQKIQKDMGHYYGESILKYKFVKRQKLYGFDNKKKS